MKWCVLFGLLFLVQGSYGSLMEEMAETTQLCCNQGTNYARNHTSEDCSSSIPPDVPPNFGSLCIFAMDQCCKEYFQKKKDCEGGIDLALAGTNSCRSTKYVAEICCQQCTRGTDVGRSGSGSCTITVQGSSAEPLLAGYAFAQCCNNALSKHKETPASSDRSVTVSKKPVEDSAFSLCEDFAPTELCAHHCIPVPGSYRCECNPGFKLMADGRNCIAITKNRCKSHNPCQHKCNDNGVEVKCSCRRGYQLMADGKSCEDIDECIQNPPVCLPNSNTQCHNTHGSYKCIPMKNQKSDKGEKGKCPPGFTRNLKNNACDDVNECKLPVAPCPFYLCENTIGGYKCGGVSGDPANLFSNPRPSAEDRCPPGFKSNYNEECEDVDECAMNKDDCNKMSQFCINTRGSFHCQDMASRHCPPGFKANPRTNKCEDINECEDGEDICRPDQICVNVPGEYDCKPKVPITRTSKCPDGMRKDLTTGVCTDIDECAEGTHLCDQHQNCLNTNGSHECRCKLGFEQDITTGACVDINECATDQNNCIPESQRCDNTVGSYLCIRFISCGTGYILHHSSGTCEDVDECALGTHNCARAGPEYQCLNIPGSFRCQRKPKPPPSTTPLPEYEYEYYESEEEIEEDKGSSVTPKPVTTTTPKPKTTSIATPPTTKPTEPPTVQEKKPEVPDNNVDNIIDTDPYNKPVSGFPTPEIPKYQPGPVNEPVYPIDNRPIDPRFKPIELEPAPQPDYSLPPEPYPTATETTYSPIDVNTVTKPTLVNVQIGGETATLKAEKKDDGSVLVNTQYGPKNKWTIVDEKPTDCKAGFELDEYGACFDIDECATNRHSCSGLTEKCRNTLGGYMCECAAGFRRDLFTGVCAFIPTKSSSPISNTINTHTIPKLPPLIPLTSTALPTTPSMSPTTPPPPPPTTPSPTTSPPTTTPIPTTPPPPPTTPPPPPTTPPLPPTTPPPPPTAPPPPTTSPPPPTTPPPPPPTTPPPPPPTTPPPPPPTTPSTLPPTPPPTTPPVPLTSSTQSLFWGYTDYRKYTNRPFRPNSGCDVGYRYNYRSKSCEDIDECENGQANCAYEEICVNTDGGYICECPPNWKLDETRHKCVQIWKEGEFPPGYGNEPSYSPVDGNDIFGGETKDIIQLPDEESPGIKCKWGYQLQNDQCEDIDECATGEAKCGPMQSCTNLPGGYTCRCPAGHRLVGDHECADVDECVLGGPTMCSQNADCVNTVGSYQCRCHEGFKPAPINDKVCVDLDECAESRSGSLCQQRCSNLWGGYRCSCHRGYRINADNRTCSDVDECSEFKRKILCVGKCLNEPGSYKCTCPAGYRLSEDKKSCIDIDECETGEATCANGQYGDTSDVCFNTRGSYRCHRIVCPPGYRLEGKHHCTKINKMCAPTDWECSRQPTRVSYNFITFVSNLYIPASGVNLFTMRGPAWPDATFRFELRLANANAPPSVKDKVDISAFKLEQNGNQAVISLVRSIEGPQSIVLELSMELFSRDLFGGKAVARIFIYVSEYEF